MKTNYSDLFQLKKNQSSAKLSLVEGGPGPGHHPHQQHHQHHQPTAAKYMKRLLSPSSTDRQPLPVPGGKEVKLEIAVFIPRVVLGWWVASLVLIYEAMRNPLLTPHIVQ